MFTLAIFGAFSASTVSALLLYKLVRLKCSSLGDINVNCWFCDAVHVVPYGNRNCWDCPTCDQFNGFDETGDYIKPIPAQYDEYLNVSSSAGHASTSRRPVAGQQTTTITSNNGFCANCNRNQLLKISQLASFVPRFEDRFEDEIDAYGRHLESTYRLCVSCEAVLRRKLGSQDASLRSAVHSWRRRRRQAAKQADIYPHSRSRASKWFSSLFNLPVKAQLLRFLSLTIVTVLLFAANSSPPDKRSLNFTGYQLFSWMKTVFAQLEPLEIVKHYQLLAVIGFFCLMVSIFISGREKLRLIDAISSFMWLALLFSHLTPIAALFNDLSSHYNYLPGIRFYFSLACLPLTLYGSVCSRSSVNGCLSWRSHNNRLNSSGDGSVADLDSSSSSSLMEKSEDSGFRDNRSDLDVVQDGLITTTTSIANSRSNAVANDVHECQIIKSKIDLDDGLQALKIGSPLKKPNSVSVAGIFTTRSYNQRAIASSAVPDRLKNYADFHQRWKRRRSLLQPAAFGRKTPTESSWVSGGYFSSTHSTWFRPRSFGDFQSHSCPVSRAGSVLCDDRLSVVSDPGGGIDGRGLLLSKCRFNPFGSSSSPSKTFVAGAPNGQNDLNSDVRLWSSSEGDENVDKNDTTDNESSVKSSASVVHRASANYSPGSSWKRLVLCAVLVTSLTFNALLLVHLILS